eukprot:CAMPEP_0202916442 /NCGR_PEP_ID=MMETSP1392-20130828/68583_1 /ASSEMBLY_ACC=CAM_ASM_000868 /TAXON_ID=225041 /ORGANISM="Chlamydomonas chlamydogama, Strain SAG 11-48b" /LENGTH=105 /DNA_ID=CAMNT_0049608871 /DNA_START=202 /DNA_END=519 /DNA_ORIENTATION=+
MPSLRLLGSIVAPVASGQRPRTRCSIICSSASTSTSTNDKNESLQSKVEHVKEVLRKEHEHHDRGHVLWYATEGRGKRASIGREEVHQGNLSGASVKSIDYSLFG